MREISDIANTQSRMPLEIARQAGGEGKIPETIKVFRHVKYTGIEGNVWLVRRLHWDFSETKRIKQKGAPIVSMAFLTSHAFLLFLHM